MKLAKHDLVAALGLRYDHHSAQGLFDAACKNAGLADQSHYTAGEVAAFRAALGKLGDRLQRVDERLDSLLGESPAPANVPQDPTPMPAATPEAKPANVPQDPTPMPASTAAAPAPAPDKPAPANVPQDPTPMPAASDAKPAPANVPQDPTPMPAPQPDVKPANVPQDAAPMPAATRIILFGVEFVDGECIYVCGDRPELGNWDPDRARPLTREGDAWSISVEQGPGEFKFLRRSADGEVIWEGGENRELGTALQIETSWQS